jgi:hypothetical protein
MYYIIQVYVLYVVGQSCLQYKYVDLELSSTTSERRSSKLESGDVEK